MAAKHTHEHKEAGLTVSKEKDGTIIMDFVLEWAEVEKAQEKAIKKLSETITVPGFRQGKAPIETAASHIPQETLVQEVITNILPKKIADAYEEHKITPIMYPKLELLHAHDGANWEVRATTAQYPEVKLGDYKKQIKDALTAGSIWTPEKGKPEAPKEMSPEEKENIALRTLLDNTDITLPHILVEQEADHRIADLLARLEKLGLSLENYLSSQNKDPQTLRAEYAQSATESLKLELILGQIATEQKVVIDEAEIDAFTKAAEADPRRAGKPITQEEKATIRTLLTKRKTIDALVS